MQNIIELMTKFYLSLTSLFDRLITPCFIVLVRLWVARIFWYAGLTKISNWDSTIYLFKNEYKVAVLPPELAAYVATACELLCPVMLCLGLASRLATLPLLGMTLVIQLTYPGDEHIHWAVLLGMILLFGPGKFSVDHMIKKRFINV